MIFIAVFRNSYQKLTMKKQFDPIKCLTEMKLSIQSIINEAYFVSTLLKKYTNEDLSEVNTYFKDALTSFCESPAMTEDAKNEAKAYLSKF